MESIFPAGFCESHLKEKKKNHFFSFFFFLLHLKKQNKRMTIHYTSILLCAEGGVL